jgi:hypothetical protein
MINLPSSPTRALWLSLICTAQAGNAVSVTASTWLGRAAAQLLESGEAT